MTRSLLRVYVLGFLNDQVDSARLTILADFKDSHAVERIELKPSRIDDLSAHIRELEVFLITGQPAFAEQRLRILGGRLFDVIFDRKVKSILRRATPTPNEGELRPLQLVVEDPVVASWPWEFLFDAEEDKFLCRSFYPLCRGVFGVFPRDEPVSRGTNVRVLFVLGASRADKESNIEEQTARVRHVFDRDGASEANNVAMHVVSALEPAELQAHLQDGEYDILHFYGHAGFDAAQDQGYLTFDSSDIGNTSERDQVATGTKSRIYARDLGALVLGKQIRFAFLNACQTGVAAPGLAPTSSSVAATLVSEGVPAVIATQYLMPDNNAHYFASSVYKTLAHGRSVTEAMREGRTAMTLGKLNRVPDWGIPVLYASYPDLRVFERSSGLTGRRT